MRCLRRHPRESRISESRPDVDSKSVGPCSTLPPWPASCSPLTSVGVTKSGRHRSHHRDPNPRRAEQTRACLAIATLRSSERCSAPGNDAWNAIDLAWRAEGRWRSSTASIKYYAQQQCELRFDTSSARRLNRVQRTVALHRWRQRLCRFPHPIAEVESPPRCRGSDGDRRGASTLGIPTRMKPNATLNAPVHK